MRPEKIAAILATLGTLCGCGAAGNADAEKLLVELCNNGRDDTGNGLSDCLDPACAGNAACGAGAGMCGDGVQNLGEVCDSFDFGNATCQNLGFSGGTLSCSVDCQNLITSACTGSGTLTSCGNGVLDPGETCDGLTMNGATCETVGNFAGGALSCRSDCAGYDTSGCSSGNGSVCGNDALDSGEVCDGSALDGESCQSLGFELGGTLACALSCQRFDTSACQSTAICGDGIRAGPESCDGADLGEATCQSLGQGFSGGRLECTPSCAFDTTQCQQAQSCGNGVAEGTETCDGSDLGGATCQSEGFGTGTLLCNAACTGFNTSNCQPPSSCNNGVLDAGEACDGANLAGASCQSLGYKGGTLRCDTGCGFDTSQCFGYPNCGNGTADGLDACDGQSWSSGPSNACTNFGLGTGAVTCTAECGLDFSSCQQNDYCAAQGWYGDGVVCDPCEAYGGSPDPDCTTLCAARDGQCSNWFDPFIQDYVCDAAGIRDPDCGACGNGVREGTELCDEQQFFPGRTSCTDYGFQGDSLGCRDDCTPDFSQCNAVVCGDGQIEGDETCDGNNFGGVTCQSLGYAGGTLGCTNSCGTIDTSGCTGTVTYDNGALDAGEWCDGPGGPFLYGSNSCASFGMGEGDILCGPDGIDFSRCRIWRDGASVQADYCEIKGWYNDGTFCDPCERLGGNPDPDCANLCGQNGVCADIYSTSTRSWSCPQPDPDCGTCGNGIVQGFEQCDGSAFNPSVSPSCAANGFVGGTVTCRDDCTLNFAGCQAAVCGNGVVEGNEVCDGGSVQCNSLGYAAGGRASCKSDCTGYEQSSCQGIASCGNGRIDGPGIQIELCDGGQFHTFGNGASARNCSTFSLGAGTVGCTSTCKLDFSACQQTDFCTVYGLRGNGQCDVCEAFGGAPDPDCDPSSPTFACALDGQCTDFYDEYLQDWSCKAKGFEDPDCGYCGNGAREVGEYCDGSSFGNTNCTSYGYSGGTLGCTADCTPDLRSCTP